MTRAAGISHRSVQRIWAEARFAAAPDQDLQVVDRPRNSLPSYSMPSASISIRQSTRWCRQLMRNRKSKRSTVPRRVADEEGPLRHDDPPLLTPWHDNAIRQALHLGRRSRRYHQESTTRETGVKRSGRGPMRPGFFPLAIGFASLLGAGVAAAGTLVQFPNLPGQTPAKLVGYLARPDTGLSLILGSGSADLSRHPAVVVLHGCSGFSSHSAAIADRLGSWGYVALTVDSFGPRGIASACGRGLAVQAFDAYAALQYLAGLEEVDPARIAVLGQSMGGSSVLNAVDHDMFAQYLTERFRAAVAYYPVCALPGRMMTAPTMILIGEADDWTPADRCREMIAKARPDGAPIALTVYPGAHHAFDVAWLQPGRSALGHWLEYNEPAATDAEKKTRTFLDAHLAGTSPGEPTAK